MIGAILGKPYNEYRCPTGFNQAGVYEHIYLEITHYCNREHLKFTKYVKFPPFDASDFELALVELRAVNIELSQLGEEIAYVDYTDLPGKQDLEDPYTESKKKI